MEYQKEKEKVTLIEYLHTNNTFTWIILKYVNNFKV